jgi:hypothetical protein
MFSKKLRRLVPSVMLTMDIGQSQKARSRAVKLVLAMLLMGLSGCGSKGATVMKGVGYGLLQSNAFRTSSTRASMDDDSTPKYSSSKRGTYSAYRNCIQIVGRSLTPIVRNNCSEKLNFWFSNNDSGNINSMDTLSPGNTEYISSNPRGVFYSCKYPDVLDKQSLMCR